MNRYRMRVVCALAITCAWISFAFPAVADEPSDAPKPASEAGDFPGDFDKAITLFHQGEGGKEGIGMTKLWPRVSVPALSDAQLRKALVGNSFRTLDGFSQEDDGIAFYIRADGAAEAWFTEWDKQERLDACPRKDVKGDDYQVKDGVCHKRRYVDVTGRWEIRNNQFCPSLTWQGGATQQCWYFVMLLNRLALFDPAGNMLGNEKTLHSGRALDRP